MHPPIWPEGHVVTLSTSRPINAPRFQIQSPDTAELVWRWRKAISLVNAGRQIGNTEHPANTPRRRQCRLARLFAPAEISVKIWYFKQKTARPE